MIVAALVFRESVSARIWLSAALMFVGASLLSYAPGARFGFSLHGLAVIGACIAWAFDNNLTRAISTQDPFAIAMIKGVVAGTTNLALGLAVGGQLPSPATSAAALAVGAASYGASLVLFILALRHIGTARTAAHFGTAPFVGAALSLLLLGEPMSILFVAALALMVAATWLVVSEHHEHEHTHEPLEHAHEHVHDEHHRHDHAGDEGPEPHAHAHRHDPVRHTHPHLPDIHHRHDH
jgi:drug/metabolite transporter (DMT)-like permease